ncbi:hypothetical protein WN48_02939 [Eufriesea mexicana]|nr:hypothetical protein WN48_02939 [Eufriesea mexicana]
MRECKSSFHGHLGRELPARTPMKKTTEHPLFIFHLDLNHEPSPNTNSSWTGIR